MVTIDHIKETKGLSFVSINARSVFNKRVNAFKIICSSDFTGIVETWLGPDKKDIDMYVPGYQYLRLDRFPNRNKKAGGLMLYMRDTFLATADMEASSITKDYEILCVDVEVGVIKYKIYMYAIGHLAMMLTKMLFI